MGINSEKNNNDDNICHFTRLQKWCCLVGIEDKMKKLSKKTTLNYHVKKTLSFFSLQNIGCVRKGVYIPSELLTR